MYTWKVDDPLGYCMYVCLYVCMYALTEVGTSYMDMKEGMPVWVYVCEDLSEEKVFMWG